MIVHHSGRKKGNRDPMERGSSALRAAVDTMIRVSTDGAAITFKCEKQKDAEKFEALSFKLHDVEKLGKNADGEDLKSAVVVPAEAYIPVPTMDRKREMALLVLAAAPKGIATFAAWREETEKRLDEQIAERTFHDFRKDLQKLGYVDRVVKGTYQITEAGAATASNLQPTATVQLPHPAATAPTPEGGAVQEGSADELENTGLIRCEVMPSLWRRITPASHVHSSVM
jgi:hypothetical protein